METAVARIEVLIALMEAAGRWEQLFAWNETLAAGVSPWLDLACAKGRNLRYEYEEGDRLLARAYAAFEHREEAFGIQAVTLQMGTVAIQQGQIAKAVSLLGPLREDLAREHPLRGRALHSLGRAYVRLGQINRGVQILEEALSVQRKHNDRASVAYINQDLYIAYLRRGEVNKAQAALHEYVALIRQRKDRVRLALALNNLGYFYHQQGQFTLAKDALQEGLQIAAYMSDRRSEGYLCWSLGDLHRDIDEPDTAVYCYERALHTIDDGEPTLRLAVLLSFSVLRRWQGSRHEAMRLAEEAEAIAYEYEIRVEELFAQALQITCRADTDNAQGLLTALNAIKDELVELGAVEQTVRVYAFVARLRLLSDQRNQAQDTLSRAAELAGEGLFPLALECAYTPLLEEYVREAKAFDELVAYIDHIQDAADSEQIESSLAVDATYEIAVRTFGAISIQRDGQATHWAAAAAKRLFLYLLFEGRHTREDISLVFWPDKSAERVRSNFHTTVHRVRQALGESSLVYERPFFQINPHITVWCDAHELREAVETAQLLPVSDARAEELYRKACDLYQGRFLPGFEDDDWVQPRQTFYEDLHNRALIGLGRCIRERGDGENAEMVFKQALELDNLDEAVHRELIITYAQRGDKHLIARHRDLVIGVFESELGVLPSQDLLDLIDLLLSE
ncbi:MAG: hypothetical protein GYB64_06640 [Chloroflexi bacterium]|nr:hypothetical protein [Chloroflexota bacterium]